MGSLTWTDMSSCYRGGEKEQRNRCQLCFSDKLSLINLNMPHRRDRFSHRCWNIFESLLKSKVVFSPQDSQDHAGRYLILSGSAHLCAWVHFHVVSQAVMRLTDKHVI